MTTATSLFAGGGGDTEGMTQAGLHVELAANHWQVALDTHQANHPDTEHRIANLSEVDWRTYPSTDVLWASPSCVWHARAGGRRRPSADIERLRLDAGAIDRATAFAVIAAAEVHAYPVIFVENVPEFRKWTLFPWWIQGLEALGYRTQEMVLNAADFGHAQNRKRMFISATRDGIDLDLTMPGIAPVPASAIVDDAPMDLLTSPRYVSPQIDSIPEPDVPYLVTYRNHAKAHRADAHQLATITAGGNHHAVAMVDRAGNHYHRMLTNRECARGQGFGDDYVFHGKPDQVKRQIGNAVPVGIAKWLGERAVEALTGQRSEVAA